MTNHSLCLLFLRAELKALPDRQNEEWLLRPRDLVLKINNEQHMFPFDGQRQSVHQLAIDFCSKNGMLLTVYSLVVASFVDQARPV